MDIRGLPSGQVQNQESKALKEQGRAAGASKAASGIETPAANERRSDSVSLSPQAQTLRQAHDSLSQLPDVDQERVAALKQAVDSGEYQVDAIKLAQNMLDSEQNLF